MKKKLFRQMSALLFAALFLFSAALAEQDAWAAIRLVDELMRGGKECMVFAKDMSAHVRALLTAKTCGKEIADILEITEEDAEEYLREKHFRCLCGKLQSYGIGVLIKCIKRIELL